MSEKYKHEEYFRSVKADVAKMYVSHQEKPLMCSSIIWFATNQQGGDGGTGLQSVCARYLLILLQQVFIINYSYPQFTLFIQPFRGHLLKIKFMYGYWMYILAGKCPWQKYV